MTTFSDFRSTLVDAIKAAVPQWPALPVAWENDGLNAGRQYKFKVLLSTVSHVAGNSRTCIIDETNQKVFTQFDVSVQARCESYRGGFAQDGYQLAMGIRMQMMGYRVQQILNQAGIVVATVNSAPGNILDISPETSPSEGAAISRAYLEIPCRYVEEADISPPTEELATQCITSITANQS